MISVIDLWRPGKPEHRGFWLGRRSWGNGYMTDAVIPVTDFAFNDLGFDRIVFANAVGNLRSRRIKEKAGATFIRVEPATFVDPIYQEHELWELSRDAWNASKMAARTDTP